MGNSFWAGRTSATERRLAALLTSPSMVPRRDHLNAVSLAMALPMDAFPAAAAAAGQCFPEACCEAGLLSLLYD